MTALKDRCYRSCRTTITYVPTLAQTADSQIGFLKSENDTSVWY
jgi:predicted metal-binding membrane protein